MEMAVLSSLSSKKILVHLAKWSIRPRGDQYGLWDLFLKMSLLVLDISLTVLNIMLKVTEKGFIYKRSTFALVNLRAKEGIPRFLKGSCDNKSCCFENN